jgi:hypothetical protein
MRGQVGAGGRERAASAQSPSGPLGLLVGSYIDRNGRRRPLCGFTPDKPSDTM